MEGSILGNELRNIQTPQQLEELNRRLQAELNTASAALNDGRYTPVSGWNNHRPSRPSGSSRRYDRSGPDRSLRQDTEAFRNARREYSEYNPSPQWDNGAHNSGPFSSPPAGRGRGLPIYAPSMAPPGPPAYAPPTCPEPGRDRRFVSFDTRDPSRDPSNRLHGLPDLDRLTLRRQEEPSCHIHSRASQSAPRNLEREPCSDAHSRVSQSASRDGEREPCSDAHGRDPFAHGSHHASSPVSNHASRRDRHNSTVLNHSDEELMDRVYNLYHTPHDYRHHSGAPPPCRTNDWEDDPNCSANCSYPNCSFLWEIAISAG